MAELSTPGRTPRRRLGLRLIAACLFAAAIGTGGAVAAAAPDTPTGNDAVTSKTAPTPPASLDNSITGLPGHQVVNSVPTNCNAGSFCFVSIACPTGKLVTGGGASNSAFGTVFMSDSRPNGNTGWVAFLKNNGSTSATVSAWAICVTP